MDIIRTVFHHLQTLHQTRSWASQTNNCTNCAHYWLGRLCTLIECDVFLQSGLIFKIGPLCCKQFVASETEQQWDQRQDQTVLSKVSRLFPLRTQLGLHRWQFSNGTVTRLNRTIKDSQKEKQVISCHQFNSVGNPIRMLFCYKNKAECFSVIKIKQNACFPDEVCLIIEISVANSVELSLGGFTG